MEEDAKPRKFADRIALQQARQAEIDSVLEQQMRELDIVTPSNPRRFMDKIALQKQRQDDLQKILASVRCVTVRVEVLKWVHVHLLMEAVGCECVVSCRGVQ